MNPDFSHLATLFSRRSMTRAAVVIALVALILPIVGSVGAVGEEGPLMPRYTVTGSYGIAAWGVGMLNTGAGDIPLNVPGNSVVQAYLYWAMLDIEGGPGDDQVTFTVDPAGGSPVPVNLTADTTYGPAFWGDPAPPPDGYTVGDHYVYVEDITSLVLLGNHTYRVSDLLAGEERYGAGIVVVYSDPTLPSTTIDIRDGLDSFFWDWAPPLGPNSEINCVTFAPSAQERLLDFAFLGAGVSFSEFGGDRPDKLWTVTGNGTPPTELIVPPYAGAYEINHQTDASPFDSHVGPQFDVLLASQTAANVNGTRGVVIPANDTYACFQVESDNSDPALSGASMVWIALATSLRVPQTTQPLASLGDRVWEDLNNNGVQDAGEPGVPGVTVNLYLPGSTTPLTTTTTDSSGNYLFSDLEPGNYQVQFVLPPGYNFSPQDQGADDAADSDADTTTGYTQIITLDPGETDLTWDAGIFRSTTPPTVQLCYDIPSVGSVGAGQAVTYTLIIRNPSGNAYDPAIAQQTININVFTSIVDVVMGRGTATVSGSTLVMNFGAFSPTDVVQVLLTLQADPGLGGPVNNPDPFLATSDSLLVCPQPESTPAPGSTPVPTVDIEQITSLPATGYPPVAESSDGSAVDVRLLAMAALALTALGALVLTRRKAR